MILDLDETLVYTQLKCCNKQAFPIKCEKSSQIYYVHKRPYLEKFLKKMSKKYNLILYSASSKSYME